MLYFFATIISCCKHVETNSGAELRQKIDNERSESGRLREEINEVQTMREDVMSDEESDSDDSDYSVEEEDLMSVLQQLISANAQLEVCYNKILSTL